MLFLERWFSTGDDFASPDDIWKCLETLLVVRTKREDTTGIQWIETKDAAKYPTMHRAPPPPTAKNNPAQNVNNIEVEKSCSRGSHGIRAEPFLSGNLTSIELGSVGTNPTTLGFQSRPGIQGISNTTIVTTSWKFTLHCRRSFPFLL